MLRAFVRNGLGVLVWLYIFLTLFVFDVDRQTFQRIDHKSEHLLVYKLLAILLVLAVVAFLWKKLLATFLYVVFFPLIVLFWKLPLYIYHRRSAALPLAIINALASLFDGFKWNLICTVAWLVSAAVILVSHNPVALILFTIVLFAAFIRSYARTIRHSFRTSRFVDVQTKLVNSLSENNVPSNFLQVDESFKSDEVQVLTESQVTKFVNDLTTGIFVNRLMYYWAYQLDQYRQGPLPYIFMFLSYLWLLLSTLISLSFVNIAILHGNPSSFSYSSPPSIITMIHYTFASLALGGIFQVTSQSSLAQSIQIVAGIAGPILLLALVLTVLLALRLTRQNSDLENTVSRIRRQGDQMSATLQANYEVSVEVALRKLQALGAGALMPLIRFISEGMPEDFMG